jgi:hypothetical protein
MLNEVGLSPTGDHAGLEVDSEDAATPKPVLHGSPGQGPWADLVVLPAAPAASEAVFKEVSRTDEEAVSEATSAGEVTSVAGEVGSVVAQEVTGLRDEAAGLEDEAELDINPMALVAPQMVLLQDHAVAGDVPTASAEADHMKTADSGVEVPEVVVGEVTATAIKKLVAGFPRVMTRGNVATTVTATMTGETSQGIEVRKLMVGTRNRLYGRLLSHACFTMSYDSSRFFRCISAG